MKDFLSKYNYLVIEGNIGSGKTTLATKIAVETDSRLILEEFADNPFLPQFYANPPRFAFPLELSFLAERYNQLKEKFLQQELFEKTTVTDYLFVKSLIFAKINLREDEFELYCKLFNIINPMLPRPGLIVYLYKKTEKLLGNIKQRGRSYEQNISGEYLDKVHNSYMAWFRQSKDLKILILNTEKTDFVNSEKDYTKLAEILSRDYKAGINTMILK